MFHHCPFCFFPRMSTPSPALVALFFSHSLFFQPTSVAIVSLVSHRQALPFLSLPLPSFFCFSTYLTTVVHFGSIINSVHSIRSRHSFRVTYLPLRSESSIIINTTTTTTTPSSASPPSHTYHTLSATHPGNPNTARHLVLTTTILLSLLILLCPPTAA
ncbi:uncharacterized protein B0T23DRAFT_8683 [Neurospora hispaniola]|uniref:Uncharacterized protein n=1 Tax=Neurospora hispaniola TaxID=588809 RepID=A0AAJ0MUX1_9PEZI|nr:hypothetical protein B0T23DRAFT_8683 [Neurospora hispaniola]